MPALAHVVRGALNRARRDAIHLFLLCPPLSGSTVLQRLLETSPALTSFPVEGQWLPGAREQIGGRERWDPDLDVDWRRIRDAFLAHWSPRKKVRFEKSPPHLVRARGLERTFPDSRFLVAIREPHAQIEGLLRRGWIASPEEAAAFWIRCAEHQLRNVSELGRVLRLRYEDLGAGPDEVVARILAFVPELRSLDPRARFRAHNVTGRSLVGLHDLNARKIAALEPATVARIDAVLGKRTDLLEAFGYALRAGDASRG